MRSDPPFVVRKAAVLGAGVMGAQISAHLVNADVAAMPYELPAKEGDPNGNVLKAIENLKRLEPSPLSTSSKAGLIEAANYDQHLDRLKECDIIIEAISERMDLKSDLYRKVAPHIGEHAVFATNTSGLSINKLSESLPQELRKRFCGVHFFNPPRYMHLVELIPCRDTGDGLLDELERFLVTTLGKGVVRAKDTPNFIANRVGVFSLLATIHHAERPYSFEKADGHYLVRLNVPFATRGEVGLFKKGDELVVEIGSLRRHIGLPTTMAALAPVRHTTFQGTTTPNTSRPRFDGRPYCTHTSAPDSIAARVGRQCLWSGVSTMTTSWPPARREWSCSGSPRPRSPGRPLPRCPGASECWRSSGRG